MRLARRGGIACSVAALMAAPAAPVELDLTTIVMGGTSILDSVSSEPRSYGSAKTLTVLDYSDAGGDWDMTTVGGAASFTDYIPALLALNPQPHVYYVEWLPNAGRLIGEAGYPHATGAAFFNAQLAFFEQLWALNPAIKVVFVIPEYRRYGAGNESQTATFETAIVSNRNRAYEVYDSGAYAGRFFLVDLGADPLIGPAGAVDKNPLWQEEDPAGNTHPSLSNYAIRKEIARRVLDHARGDGDSWQRPTLAVPYDDADTARAIYAIAPATGVDLSSWHAFAPFQALDIERGVALQLILPAGMEAKVNGGAYATALAGDAVMIAQGDVIQRRAMSSAENETLIEYGCSLGALSWTDQVTTEGFVFPVTAMTPAVSDAPGNQTSPHTVTGHALEPGRHILIYTGTETRLGVPAFGEPQGVVIEDDDGIVADIDATYLAGVGENPTVSAWMFDIATPANCNYRLVSRNGSDIGHRNLYVGRLDGARTFDAAGGANVAYKTVGGFTAGTYPCTGGGTANDGLIDTVGAGEIVIAGFSLYGPGSAAATLDNMTLSQFINLENVDLKVGYASGDLNPTVTLTDSAFTVTIAVKLSAVP